MRGAIPLKSVVPLALLLLSLMLLSATGMDASDAPPAAKEPAEEPAKKFTATEPAAAGPSLDRRGSYEPQRLRGRVVWLAEALQRKYKIRSVPEAAERTLALETIDGKLVPIVEDVRGRAFRRDERLRNMEVELMVRPLAGSAVVQIIRVYEVDDKGVRAEIDYWCEICAIAMYELKVCDCCQGPIELRRRPQPESQ